MANRDAVAGQVVELARELVSTSTVNPALVPDAPGKRLAVELLATRLARKGLGIEIVGPVDRPSRHRGAGRPPCSGRAAAAFVRVWQLTRCEQRDAGRCPTRPTA